MSVVAEYVKHLEELVLPAKPTINNLTQIAEENIEHFDEIATAIERRIQYARPSHKLPALYLLDSIVKNIRDGRYIIHFARNIADTFCHAFESTDGNTQQALLRLLDTWPNYFEPSILDQIKKRIFIFLRHGTEAAALARDIQHNMNAFAPPPPVAPPPAPYGAPVPYYQSPAPPMPPPHPGLDPNLLSAIQADPNAAVLLEMINQHLASQRFPSADAGVEGINQNLIQALAQQLANRALPPPPPPPPIPAIDPAALLTSVLSAAMGMAAPAPPPPPPSRHNYPPPQSYPPHPQQSRHGRYSSSAPRGAPSALSMLPPSRQPGPLQLMKTSVEFAASGAAFAAARAAVIPNLKDYNQLRSLNEYALSELYDMSHQCTDCGLRFNATDALMTHKDWHFKMNRREKDRKEKQTSRRHYLPVEQWVRCEDIDMFAPSGDASIPPLEGGPPPQTENADSVMKSWVAVLPTDAEDEVCSICHEPLKKIFDSSEDVWRFEKSFRSSEKVVHTKCFNEPA